MTIVLMFLKTYWKNLLIAALLGAFAYGVLDYAGQRHQLASMKSQLKDRDNRIVELIKESSDKSDKLTVYEKTAEDQRKSHLVAEQQRLKVISVLTTQISALKRQEIPKECPKAIEFIIEHKDELQWPKQ